jgi:golgi phosphoprotein 3
MEFPLTSQFLIISLHPEKGRIMIDGTHFRYTLTGAVLMDFLLNGEISLNKNRMASSFWKNGDLIHDTFADIISGTSKPKRISYWVRRLTRKRRLIFKETLNPLVDKGVIRHERRYFLNIIPYNRYFIRDISLRSGIIDEVRNVLLHNKTATSKQLMLLGLIKASGSYRLLAKEKGERRLLRKRCDELLKNDAMATEIDKAIREVQAAIIGSVTAATAAASASH